MMCYVLSGKNTLFCLLNKNICVRLNLQSGYVFFFLLRASLVGLISFFSLKIGCSYGGNAAS